MAKQYHTPKSKIYHCIYIGSEAVETKMWFVVILLLVSELLRRTNESQHCLSDLSRDNTALVIS